MAKNRNKRRFYPEFYTDEEFRQMQEIENQKARQAQNEAKSSRASAELAEMRAEYAQKLQEYYIRETPEILIDTVEEPVGRGIPDAPPANEPNEPENIAEPEPNEKSTLFSEPSEFNGFDYVDYFENAQSDNADIVVDDEIIDNDPGEITIEIPQDMHVKEPDALPVFAPVPVFEPEEYAVGRDALGAPLNEFDVPDENEFGVPDYDEEEHEHEEETPPENLWAPLIPPLPPSDGAPRASRPTIENPGMIAFDREKAVEYARRWALDRNPEYYNYEDIGGDCTNYISQILHAGGCQMDKSSPARGWYYNNANDKSHSWTGVEQLYDYLMREKEHGIFAKEIGVNEVRAGDIAQLSFNGKNFQHTPFITSVDGGIKICAHSYDSLDRPLDSYQWRKIRFIRILGWR